MIFHHHIFYLHSHRLYSEGDKNFNDCFGDNIRKLFKDKLACKSALINGINLSSKVPMCSDNETSRNITSDAIEIFVSRMQNLDEFGCPLPCSHFTYSINLVRQHKNAFELFTGENRTEDYHLFFYYSSLESDVESENLIVDFPNLVANIGGYLGLLLGFSCLTIYLSVLDLAKAKIK